MQLTWNKMKDKYCFYNRHLKLKMYEYTLALGNDFIAQNVKKALKP